MSSTFTLLVSYNQIAIFDPALPSPFNDWTDGHVAQGFAWREGSVSFVVPDGEETFVEIRDGGEPSQFDEVAIRSIRVPFRIEGERLAIASIGDEAVVQSEPGRYQLVFDLFDAGTKNGNEYRHGVRLTFSRSDDAVFSVDIAEDGMTAEPPFLTDAKPAQ